MGAKLWEKFITKLFLPISFALPPFFPNFTAVESRILCIRFPDVVGKEESRVSGFPTPSARKKVGFPGSRRRRQGRKSGFQVPDVVGKEESRVSRFPTPSARKKVGFPASRRRRQGRKSGFRLPDVVGKEESRVFRFPTSSAKKKVGVWFLDKARGIYFLTYIID